MVEATVVAERRPAFWTVLACLLAAGGIGCGGTEVVTPPPPEVSISQPIEEPVQDKLEFIGRTRAVESVEVRARVTGYITKVAFAEGALVNAGDLLFEIDPREYQAAVLRAEGQVARLRAQVARTDAEVARNQALRPSGAASARELERSVADKGAVEGELKTATAQLDLARLDLEFTRVTAPIAGRVSRAEITQGNLVVVGPSGGP
jgi:multidrug efflux system membrane fusion protein